MTDDRKPSYQTELKERIAHFYTSDLVTAETREDRLARLYEFVREVALESFQNGKEAGAQGAQNSYRGRRPRMAPARIQGTALANGRLKPVAQ